MSIWTLRSKKAVYPIVERDIARQLASFRPPEQNHSSHRRRLMQYVDIYSLSSAIRARISYRTLMYPCILGVFITGSQLY